MGQKIHPLGLRLGITQKHDSIWYTRINQYSTILKEDFQIRNYFKNISKILRIKINRNIVNKHIKLDLYSADSKILFEKYGPIFQILKEDLKKFLSCKYTLSINVTDLESSDLTAVFLADLIATQVENRVSTKQAINIAMQKAQQSNFKGIKIKISGRLNGTEIAREEWVKEGSIPLQTLSANVDYASAAADTVYGLLGIKVWLF